MWQNYPKTKKKAPCFSGSPFVTFLYFSDTIQTQTNIFHLTLFINIKQLSPHGNVNFGHKKTNPKWSECIVTFNNLSPVVFATEGTSDKTGETAPILPIAAALLLAGAIFFGAKYRFAK